MVREYTLSNTGTIAAGSYAERYLTWAHEGTSQYVLENMQLKFVISSSAGYHVTAFERISGVTVQQLNKSGYPSAGSTVTVAMDSGAWSNRTGGSLTFRFYAPAKYTISYTSIKVILTYRAVAEPSTITVETAMAGEGQTVRITNTDPDVTHQVRWQYSNASSGWSLDSGVISYGASTRAPAWAVPAADMAALWAGNTETGKITGTVTVVTCTGDGTQVGTTTADAELLLPETETTKPAITAAGMSGTPDTVAQHIAAVTGNQWVEDHTTATYSVTAAGYQGATITRIRVLTPDGSLTLSSGTGSAVVRTAGRYAVGLEVEDSRGFIRTVTEQWVLQEVQAYHQPIITSLQAIRCDSSGQEAEDGGHVWVEASAVLADIAHTLTLRAAIREKGGSQIGTKAVMTGGTVILGGNLSEEITYVVTVEAEDEYGLTDEAEIEIGTGIITFSRLAGGKGVAFGKAAERYGVEIREEWPFFTHGQEILRLVVDMAHPPGSILETADAAFDPNTQWPWTVWGKLGSGKWARGV